MIFWYRRLPCDVLKCNFPFGFIFLHNYTDMFMGSAKNWNQYTQSQKQPSFSLWAKKICKITLSLLCSWKSTPSFSPTRLKFASNIFCFVTKFSTLVTKVWLPSLLNFDKIDETFLLIHVTCSVLGNGKWHSIQRSFLTALKR